MLRLSGDGKTYTTRRGLKTCTSIEGGGSKVTLKFGTTRGSIFAEVSSSRLLYKQGDTEWGGGGQCVRERAKG